MNLIDFNNWTRYFSGNFSSIELFNNQVYVSSNRTLYKFENNELLLLKTYTQTIESIKSSESTLSYRLGSRF